METYDGWGPEAIEVFSTVASCLAVRTNASKSRALATVYGHISMILVRVNAGAILMRSYLPSSALFWTNIVVSLACIIHVLYIIIILLYCVAI